MNNFPFKHKGKTLWYSRSCCTVSLILALDENQKVNILVTKRGKNTPDYQYHWCLPCGYVDFNETIEEAAVREIKEETSLIFNPDKLELLYINSDPKENCQNISFRFKIVVGCINDYKINYNEIDENEVEEVKWVNKDEIDNHNWAFNHKKLIEEYLTI